MTPASSPRPPAAAPASASWPAAPAPSAVDGVDLRARPAAMLERFAGGGPAEAFPWSVDHVRWLPPALGPTEMVAGGPGAAPGGPPGGTTQEAGGGEPAGRGKRGRDGGEGGGPEEEEAELQV